MVFQDGAPSTLLDSYEQERKPHVRTLVATAKEFGLIIGELDPEAARVRDETLRRQLERGEVETIRQRFVPNLTSGVIDLDPDAQGAGTLFVQPKIKREDTGDEVLLDDLLQFRFLIATTTAQSQTWLTPESLELWRRIRGERIVIGVSEQIPPLDGFEETDVQHLAETDTLFAGWMSQLGCAAAVVRPDRYVFGTASDAAQLNRLVAAVVRHVFGPDLLCQSTSPPAN
jgi:3-(3-hydroxy-phenyl)propionate hydroxylase